MKAPNVSNQVIVQNFFKALIGVVSENTSNKYSLIAVNGINKNLNKKFKFSKNVKISNGSVNVGQNFNSIGRKELKNYFTQIINLAGSDYLRSLLAKRLTRDQIRYFQYIGLKLF